MSKRRVQTATSVLLAFSLALVACRPSVPAPTLLPGAAGARPAASAGARAAGARLAAPEPLSPAATRDLLEAVIPPARDEADLVRRFRQACGTPIAPPVTLTRDDAVGDSHVFWVLDEPNRSFFQMQATLRYASPHLLFYVQDGMQVRPEALASSADVFEQKTYPMLRQYFGDLPQEPRITIFNGRVPGLGGYFSSSDLYPQSVNPFSNERVMVFMNWDATRPGTANYDSVLAHESQHFVHWVVHPQQDSWVNEGASELAMTVDGYDQGSVGRAYLNNTDIQLNGWAEQTSETAPYYGGGYVMLEYFAERMGGYDAIKSLIAAAGPSVHTFESYFADHHTGLHFDDLFRDFVLANVLNDRSIGDGRYGYQRVAGKARIQESGSTLPAVSKGALHPYAAHYVELLPNGQRGDLDLHFDGSSTVPLIGSPPHSGQALWWGNAADEMESTITREVDLTGVSQATLHFSTWYDVERDYDYAGVAVSTDGGCTWKTVPGQHTTDTNPVGQNPGSSFTGRSGGGDNAVWVDETMDLSAYAGQKFQLSFYYITDQSYHGPGFAVDDISIPEIGFTDDAESDEGWLAKGFIRSVNAEALDWAVQVVSFGDAGTQVTQLPLRPSADGASLSGSLTVQRYGDAVKRVLVAISPLAPVTLEPAGYQLQAQLH